MKLTQKDLDNLNTMLMTAVDHGGDTGGAYFCYPDEFYESVRNFVKSSEDKIEVCWVHFEFGLKGHSHLCESTLEDVEKGRYKEFIQVKFNKGE